MEWIKCTDRLPELDEVVLIAVPGYKLPIVAWLHGGGGTSDCFDGGFFFDDGEPVSSYEGIPTHWRYMPELPQRNKAMNPNKELLQAIIDGKTVQYQYVSPSEENAILLGQWYDFKPDLLGSLNHSATVQMFGLSVEDEFKMNFRVVD